MGMQPGRTFPHLVVLSAFAAACTPAGFGPVALDEMARASASQVDGDLGMHGLSSEVLVIRDRWGVPHIYAENLDDLFFAQGFVQAQDRLWQMEMWRRTMAGRVSEIMGPSALEHDRLMRLLQFRGPWDAAEWTSYHPDGQRIFTAFTRGINAFIEQAHDNLPVEFKLTGIQPQEWTPEDVLLRNPRRSLGSARAELELAMSVAQLGVVEANRRAHPDPWDDLSVPEGLDVKTITEDVVAALDVMLGELHRPELLPKYQVEPAVAISRDRGAQETDPGSNNWVVSGALTASGGVILANDPHRQVTSPSLRYIVHLSAPEWEAIGATEPVIPGVAIGHNGRVAWGLTIVGTDYDDVFVEDVNPANPKQVRYQGRWEPLRVITDTIHVKGEGPRVVELKFSRHGPVFYEDPVRHKAYALRSILHAPGTAEYLGALRLNQTADCREFLKEADYWKAPSENLICGDAQGNIAWQASALTPRRRGWLGRLPVPGTGGFEWVGFRDDLPWELNPARGWIATANHNVLPPGYHPPLFFKQAPYPRYERIAEALSAGASFTVADFQRLQHDTYSAQADRDRKLFGSWTGRTVQLERARLMIIEWDGVFGRESAAAALYSVWARRLDEAARRADVLAVARDSWVEAALAEAVDTLTATQGAHWSQWRWGRIHRSEFPHPLVSAFDLPAVERSGGAGTVAGTGATYRHIIDFADLDASVATNAPGQSGQPGSPFYGNLLMSWVNQEYFALLFSRAAVEAHGGHRLVLAPGQRPAGRNERE